MKAQLLDIRDKLCQPWLMTVLLVALIPLFPEYVAPFLAGGSLVTAIVDARLHRRELSLGLLGKMLLLYMAYMAVGILYAAKPFNSLGTVMMWLVAFLVYLAMSTVLTNRHRIDAVLFCITVVAGLVGFIACVQYILNAWFGIGVPFYFWNWIDEVVYRVFPMPLTLDIHEMRSASTFNNQNVMAEYLIMMMPFVMFYTFGGNRTGTRVLRNLNRCCLLFALGGVAFSFSRGAYLSLLLIVLIFCVANIKRRNILLIGTVAAVVLIPTSIMSRLFSVGSMDGSITERIGVWGVTLEEIIKHPVFGTGPGIQNLWNTLSANGYSSPHAHNLVLQLLAEGGLIALSLMVFIGWKMFRRSFKMLSHSTETRTMGVVFLAFIGAFILYGMVDFPFLCPKLMCVFMLVLGISDSVGRVYMEERVEGLSSLGYPAHTLRRTPGNAVISKTK